ncbi:XRE family transcriptional regulator [Mycobacteroides abscessus subsp. abscessus]|nr:XRE family transcriptional regulator [Mycobacteroides abscessus subsp. abscessus]
MGRYNRSMRAREVLDEVMRDTGMTQSELARLSGVRQPSISQILAGKIDCSDDQLTRLLACMGYRLEITRRAVNPNLTRSEHRSWAVHRQLATHLTPVSLTDWGPTILANITRLRTGVRGQPHLANLDRWERIVETNDVPALRRALTGLDRQDIEMREVTPMGGLLPDEERREALRKAV